MRLLFYSFATVVLCSGGVSSVVAGNQDVSLASQRSSHSNASNKVVASAVLQLWSAALKDVRQGAYRAALPKLERLVSSAPGETQFRLELARTLFLIGIDDRARYHFRLSLGDATLSDAEVTVVERYLDQIEARSAWTGWVSFAVVPESNPGQRTSTQSITIGGLPFEISPDARVRSGVGILLSGRLRWSPLLSRDLRGRFEVSGWHEAFKHDDFNDLYVSALAGVDLLADRGSRIGIAVTYRHRWIAGQSFSFGPGVEITGARRFGRATRGWGRFSITDLRHEDFTKRDGLRAHLGLGVERAVTQQFVTNASVFAKRADAKAASESYREAGMQLGGRYALEGGVLMGLQAWAAYRQYDGEQSFFPEAREDTRWGSTATISHRDVSWNGFAPELSLTYEARSSNIDLYSYDNVRLSIGVTRDF